MISKAADPGALELARNAVEAQGAGTGSPFSPGIPLTPYDGVSGLPRAWNFPTGYNIKGRVDRDGRLDFTLLKTLIESYDIANMCINHRIDDVRSLAWNIRSADWVTENNPADIDVARAALKRPDGRTPFRAWLAKFLQDILRYDAGTLYRRRTMDGRVCGLEVVSGTTIAPVLDYWGRTPAAPAPAYVQYVAGQPWEWLTTDDLIYVPFRPQSDSPYGMSPIESVLLTANTDLRFQKHFLDWFTEGNVPEGFATAPEDLTTPEQLEQWQAYWEAMNTDARVKHKIKMMPHGTTLEFPQDKKFDPTFPLYLMRKVCAAYHVTPADLGFTEDVNRSTGDTQADVQFRIGTVPLVQHVQDILTDYLQDDLGLAVVFEFDTGRETEDRVATAQADQIYIQNGVVSVDEVRERQYGLATDAERPTPRFIYSTRQGPIPLRSLLDVAGAIDPETAAPSDLTPLDEAPFAGTPGVLPDKLPGEPAFRRADTDPDEPRDPAAEQAQVGSGVLADPNNPAVTKELARWKSNALTRVKRGQAPRLFESDVLPEPVRTAVWKRLATANTPDAVVAAFVKDGGGAGPKAGTPSWRDDPPVRTPQHDVDLQLTDYYAPIIRDALLGMWTKANLSAAITLGMYYGQGGAVVKDGNPVASALGSTADTGPLESALGETWAAGYAAGTDAAQIQMGARDGWDDWKPGMDPSLVTGANGWQAAVDKAGVSIRDITDTTVDKLADAIEQGVAAGASVDGLARSLTGLLGDPDRAELIAHTESARMLTSAAMVQYGTMGVTEFDWVTSAGACPTCLDEAANGPYPIGDTANQPPGHPRCRCAATPRLETMTTMTPLPETPAETGMGADAALDAIRQAAKSTEIGNILDTFLGSRGTVSGFDGIAMDLERVRSLASNVVNLFEKHPKINADVEITPINKTGVLAQARATYVDVYYKKLGLTNFKLQISKAKMSKRVSLGDTFRQSADINWFHAPNPATDPMQYIVSHEFGHLMDYYSAQTLNVRKIVEDYVQDHGFPVHSREAGALRDKEMSGYAQAGGRSETIAEAFTDVITNGKDATDLSRKIYDALMKAADEWVRPEK